MSIWVSDREFLIITRKAGDELRRASCRFNMSEAEIRAYVLYLLKQGKLVTQRKTKQGIERTILCEELEMVLVWGARHGQIQLSPDGKRQNVYLIEIKHSPHPTPTRLPCNSVPIAQQSHRSEVP